MVGARGSSNTSVVMHFLPAMEIHFLSKNDTSMCVFLLLKKRILHYDMTATSKSILNISAEKKV